MDFIDNFTSTVEILKYTEENYNDEQRRILWFFNTYFMNILVGNKNDEEQYKANIVADSTGEIYAISQKWNVIHLHESKFTPLTFDPI
jgi:hypothetical protein